MRRALRMVRRTRGARAAVVSLLVLCLTIPAVPASAAGTGISSTTEGQLQRFALSLVNCVRAGGWVRSSGRCDRHPAARYRSSYHKPLRLSARITNKVSRGYAIRMARAGYLSHDLGSSFSERFARAGISRPFGEAIGFGSRGAARADIVSSFRRMQEEKITGAWSRWHWRYIREPDFHRVGIGIAKRGGSTYIVYDFAH
jgi:hypothetical protein